MSPSQFTSTFGALADGIAQQTGLSPCLFLSQWALESGWASSPLSTQCFNLAGIEGQGSAGSSGAFACYSSYSEFGQAYLSTLHNGYYAGVLASAGGSLAAQFAALGASPWDGGHYDNGGGPGSSLAALYPSIAGSCAGPAPAPPPGGGGATPCAGCPEYQPAGATSGGAGLALAAVAVGGGLVALGLHLGHHGRHG